MAGEFLHKPGSAFCAAKSLDVVALAILLLDAIFVTESRRLRDAKTAGVRSVDVSGIERLRRTGCRS